MSSSSQRNSQSGGTDDGSLNDSNRGRSSSANSGVRVCRVGFLVVAISLAAILLGVSIGVFASTNKTTTIVREPSPFDRLPPSTQKTILDDTDGTTPQSMAYQHVRFLVDHPFEAADAALLLRQFALATLYYATDGHSWRGFSNAHRVYPSPYEYGDDDDYYYCDEDSLYFVDNCVSGNSDTVLALGGTTKLRGQLPEELGLLSKLERILLPDNTLTGPIPTAMFGSQSMIALDLSDNLLSGPLPQDLGDLMPQLEFLFLSRNNLAGPLPTSLGTCTNLYALELGSNQFSGEIPSQLGRLTKLVQMQLGDNRFEGTIPSQLAMTCLTRLSLY